MFIGEYQHLIDDKGRIAVPSKFRSLLKGGVIMTKGLDRCLFVFDKKSWQPIAEKIKAAEYELSQIDPGRYPKKLKKSLVLPLNQKSS